MNNVDFFSRLFALFLSRWGQAEFVPSPIAVVSEPLLTSHRMADSPYKDDHMASRSQRVFTFLSEVKNVPINNGGLFCLPAVSLVLADQNGAPTQKGP